MSHELANDTAMPDALRLVSVSKVYGTGASSVTALDGVTVSLAAGSFTAIMGPLPLVLRHVVEDAVEPRSTT